MGTGEWYHLSMMLFKRIPAITKALFVCRGGFYWLASCWSSVCLGSLSFVCLVSHIKFHTVSVTRIWNLYLMEHPFLLELSEVSILTDWLLHRLQIAANIWSLLHHMHTKSDFVPLKTLGLSWHTARTRGKTTFLQISELVLTQPSHSQCWVMPY